MCTGGNEGTTQETTSGIGGKQQCSYVCAVIKLCFSISKLVKVNSSHSVIPVCVDVFHTVSNVHKLKAIIIIEVFVCTGENEGTTQETTSGIGGKQQYNNVLFSNCALVLVSCIKVNSSHSLLHDTIQFQRRRRANILYIGTLRG